MDGIRTVARSDRTALVIKRHRVDSMESSYVGKTIGSVGRIDKVHIWEILERWDILDR